MNELLSKLNELNNTLEPKFPKKLFGRPVKDLDTVKYEPTHQRRKGKLTLKQLYLNFPYAVFKYDPIPPQPVKILKYKVSEDLLSLDVWGEVKSATRPGVTHRCIIQLHRPDPDIRWHWDLPCEVWCSCEAFHYFLAFALYTRGNLARISSPWNKVPAKIRNPFNVPALDKHLVLLTNKLIKMGLIKGRVLWYSKKYRYGGKHPRHTYYSKR